MGAAGFTASHLDHEWGKDLLSIFPPPNGDDGIDVMEAEMIATWMRIVILVAVILLVGPITSLVIYWGRKRYALKKVRVITARRMEAS